MSNISDTLSLGETVELVANYTTTMNVADEDWQKAIAVNGLLATKKKPEWTQYAVDRAIDTQTSQGQLAFGWGNYPKEWAKWTEYDVDQYNPTTLSAALADPLLEFYNRTGDEKYLSAVEKQTEFLMSVNQSTDGGISRRRNHIELWTETLSFVCPYFIRYGDITDSKCYIQRAIDQISVHIDHLFDSHKSLFRHIWRETPDFYPASSFWSRANGWALAGLVDSYCRIPDDYDINKKIQTVLQSSIDTLLELQDNSGFWHQKIDDTTTPLESSGTLIFIYVLKKALNEGLINGNRYQQSAADGLKAICGVVDSDGAVRRVSEPPASANSKLSVTPYGQGWFLLAASQFNGGK